MKTHALHLYHRLPVALQTAVASVRGRQLHAQRYGPETDRLVAEAHARERWTPEQWQAWQDERLRFILRRAVERVPYYRDYWRNKGQAWMQLSNWPVLEKETVRQNPRAFLADDCDPRQLRAMYTSGSTGKPMFTWWSKDTTRRWFGLFEARWRQWNGVSRHDRWAMLGGQLVVPAARTKPPFWIWNGPMNQLYMSAFHLRREWLPAYLDAMEEHRVSYLWGYPSAMYQLALAANELGRKLPLRVVLANAEPLSTEQREAISEAFAAPVRETYGMAEIVAGAGECEAGSLHVFPEAGIIELPEGDEVIATGLFNPDMPLIRYRIGDRAIRGSEAPCACGRTLPTLAAIEGRMDDLVLLPDGRKIGRLDVVFKAGLPIREAQVIQEAIDHLVVRLVPSAEFGEKDAARLRARFREYVGAMRVDIEQMSAIPRNANGKFRGVLSRVK